MLFASMWHKADSMGHPMRLELTLAGLLVKLANHYTNWGALWIHSLMVENISNSNNSAKSDSSDSNTKV